MEYMFPLLSIFAFFVIFMILMRKVSRAMSTSLEGNAGDLNHSINAYIIAALHDGALEPQQIIDRISDRHHAKLPELGIDTEAILQEARIARSRNFFFGLAYLGSAFWILDRFLLYPMVEMEILTFPDYVESLLPPLLLVSLIGIIKTVVVNRYIRRNIKNFDAPINLGFSENVIVFGGFSPFAGFGRDLESWSFTIDASRPTEGEHQPPEKFKQQELLDFISSSIQNNLSSSIESDLSFVSGRRIRSLSKLLESRVAMPKSRVSIQDVRFEIGRPDTAWRHYKSVTAPISDGHLALTFFLRSTTVGKNIFIESRCFILGAIKSSYTVLNDFPSRTGFGYIFRLVRNKVIFSPFSWVIGVIPIYSAALHLFGFMSALIFGDPQDRMKKKDNSYNYGHSSSLREDLSSAVYQSYFQSVDKDRIGKTAQYVALNSIVDFLDSKGVSTTEIKERRTQIVNSGVIVSGGVLNAGQLAVGAGATAKIFNAMSSLKSKGASNVK